MRAKFDPEHHIRVLQFEYPAELKGCAELAKKVEEIPDAPRQVYSTASLVIALSTDENLERDSVPLPKVSGPDADGLLEVLDIGARITDIDAERMLARALIRQVQAQGVDVNRLVAT
jgi:hypothetical protein